MDEQISLGRAGWRPPRPARILAPRCMRASPFSLPIRRNKLSLHGEPIQCDLEAHCLCYDVIVSSKMVSSEVAGKYRYTRRAVVSPRGRACFPAGFILARRTSLLDIDFCGVAETVGHARYAQGTSARDKQDKVASIYPPALFSDIVKSPTVTPAPYGSLGTYVLSRAKYSVPLSLSPTANPHPSSQDPAQLFSLAPGSQARLLAGVSTPKVGCVGFLCLGTAPNRSQ